MKTFNQFLNEAVRHGENRCTAVTCNAITSHFGKDEAKLGSDHNVASGAGVIQHMKKHGLRVKGAGWEHEGKTVKQFVKDNPSGVHYISTRGHAMAVINGKLHDSSKRGPDGRKIQTSFEVVPS